MERRKIGIEMRDIVERCGEGGEEGKEGEGVK